MIAQRFFIVDWGIKFYINKDWIFNYAINQLSDVMALLRLGETTYTVG